jgi:transcription initiation factor TFIIF subunit beta
MNKMKKGASDDADADADDENDNEEYPPGSELVERAMKQFLLKMNKPQLLREFMRRLKPNVLEKHAKKYQRSYQKSDVQKSAKQLQQLQQQVQLQAPEWRQNATPYLLREHWRYQVCQRLSIERKDIPESVLEALRAYLFPSALDTQRSDHRAWLVKVPNFVDKAWRAFSNKRSKQVENDIEEDMNGDGMDVDDDQNDDELGKVRVVIDPFDKEKKEAFAVTLNEHINEGEEFAIPVKYIMTENIEAPEIHVFSETREGTAAATSAMDVNEFIVEAKVHKKLDMRPRDASDAAYARVSKDRMEKAQSKSRFVQSVVGADAARIAPLPKRSNLVRLADGGVTKPKADRIEKGELTDKLFTLFERRTYWNMKQLLAETKQPAMFLKETVQEIANLARRGPNNGMYCLKDMYKQQNKTAEETTTTTTTTT